jgi:hypothetical protein
MVETVKSLPNVFEVKKIMRKRNTSYLSDMSGKERREI